jgi:hypothetical protein
MQLGATEGWHNRSLIYFGLPNSLKIFKFQGTGRKETYKNPYLKHQVHREPIGFLSTVARRTDKLTMGATESEIRVFS